MCQAALKGKNPGVKFLDADFWDTHFAGEPMTFFD